MLFRMKYGFMLAQGVTSRGYFYYTSLHSGLKLLHSHPFIKQEMPIYRGKMHQFGA